MKKVILLLAAVLMFSCSDPLSKKYDSETVLKDIVELKEKLDTNQMAAIGNQLFRKKEIELAGKSYKQILEDGEKWAAEQKLIKKRQERLEIEKKRLEEKAQKEAKQRIDSMVNSVSVAVFDKGYAEGDFEKYIKISYQCINKSGKDIAGILWRISVMDMFGKEIGRFALEVTDGIKADKTINKDRYYDYSSYDPDNVKIVDTDIKKLKFEYEPQQIIFTDGTSIEK